MRGFSSKLHFTLYFWSLVLFAVSIHWMNAMTVIMTVELGVLWFLQPNFKQSWNQFLHKPSIFFFSSIVLLSVLRLPFSMNIGNSIEYTIFILPIFILSFVMGTLPKIPKEKFSVLLYFYILSTVASSIFNLIYFSYSYSNITDIRMISFFMSHIRYSLFIIIAIFACFYYLFFEKEKRPLIKFLLAVSFVWLIVFLFILQSITGVVIAIFIFFLTACIKIFSGKSLKIRVLIIATLLVCIISVVWTLLSTIHEFTNVKKISQKEKVRYTPYGNEYMYIDDMNIVENGNYVYYFVCEKELRETWNLVSKLPYDGLDLKQQQLHQTLLRYLASKSLRRDRDGILALTVNDRKNIEGGISNYKLENRFSIYSRVYQIIWEIDSYLRGGNPSGHSITQRFEFWKCSVAVVSDYFFFGIGTHDLKTTMNEYYEKVGTKLSPDKRLMPHNQYFTIMIRFGFVGLFVFLVSLFVAILFEKKQRDFFVFIYTIVIVLSMINEDTLETQYGVVLFSFWGALFIFARETKPKRAIKSESLELLE